MTQLFADTLKSVGSTAMAYRNCIIDGSYTIVYDEEWNVKKGKHTIDDLANDLIVQLENILSTYEFEMRKRCYWAGQSQEKRKPKINLEVRKEK